MHIISHLVRQAHTHFLYLKEDATDEESGEAKQTTDAREPSPTVPKDADSDPAASKEKEKPKNHIPSELQGPVRGVHIDQSYDFAPLLVKMVLPSTPPEEIERLLKGRYQILNIWRPIKTIFKDPLAVMDARTLTDEELVPIKIAYPTFELETFTVRGDRKDEHKWWYMSQQTPEDALVFKGFDSKTDGRARGVPHSSFTDEKFVDGEARQSIEVRALVFHEDDME